MDLELTDEQTWLSESLDDAARARVDRRRGGARGGPPTSATACGRRSWSSARSASTGRRASGRSSCASWRGRSAPTWPPCRSSAAPRCATRSSRSRPRAAFADLGDDRVSVALLEPGRGWSVDGHATVVGLAGLDGRKVAVEHADEVDQLRRRGVRGRRAGAGARRRAARRRRGGAAAVARRDVPMHAVTFSGVDGRRRGRGRLAAAMLARLTAVGALLAAAESVGAAGRMLDDARAYAAERRQFGRTIGSYQALRHILADMYVRQASAWSTVLYAAAALDDDLPEAQQTAAVAKAYVARAAREVAHGALQVFGGIAFTAGAPGASLPAADRRPRAAVRRRRAPRARARPALASGRRATRRSPVPTPSADERQLHDRPPTRASTTRPPSASSASAPAPTRMSSARCSRTSCTTRAG